MSAAASREAFEAWWKSILRLPHEDKHSAFMGWQASRKQALTEAAEICDDVLEFPSLGARHCAEYIRNLK